MRILASAWRALGASRREYPTTWIFVDTLAVLAALVVIAIVTSTEIR